MRINSAGGVVYLRSSKEPMVLLILDRFGFWTLPKGEIEENETPEAAALREIEEETGVSGSITKRLGATEYSYNDDACRRVTKRVEFYLVAASTSALSPAVGEIKEAKWIPSTDAIGLIDYQNMREILKLALPSFVRRDA